MPLNQAEQNHTPEQRCEIAKSIFWRVARKVVQRELKHDFEIDDENRDAIIAFVAYFTNNTSLMEQLGIDPRKGIMIIGNPGSGKSLLFRIVKECLNTPKYRPYFRYFSFYNCETPAKTYMKDGDIGLEKYTKLGCEGLSGTMDNVCLFDDLGSEEIKNNYGNKKEVMVDVIIERYEKLLSNGLITHFTSNLTPEEIESRYSTRVRSRLRQMCNMIVMGSEKDYKDRR